MRILKTTAVLAAICLALTASAGAVNLELVTIGDAGNAGELSGLSAGGYGAWGPDRPNTGAVSYNYYMGTYEVTSSQYAEFLNAVAATDPYGLYNPGMAHVEYSGSGWYIDRGCHIERSGADGSYTYAVTHGWDNRPVNFVSAGDSFRFINWLHNGQPTGAADLTTTEDGSYYLNGINDNASLLAVTREADGKYFLPTEDEWYKAAFYDPTLNAGAGGYYDFAMQTDNPTLIDNDILPVDPGFSANYRKLGNDCSLFPHPGVAELSFGVASDVGEFENSASYYGTSDQSGNILELVHEVFQTDRFLGRGGYYGQSDLYLTAGCRHAAPFPTTENATYGFRVTSFVAPVVPGDFDGDGDVDAVDIDALADAIRLGLTDAKYDLTGDSLINTADLDMMVRSLVETAIGNGTEYGDFNLDGQIDTTDLTRLATFYGPGTKWDEGNANRNIDLQIDNTDLTILATYYGTGPGDPDVVPEPASAGLLLLGASAVLRRRRKAKRQDDRLRRGTPMTMSLLALGDCLPCN